MARAIKLIVYVFVFVIFVGKFLPGWARETGIALRDLIFGPQHDSPPWLWTALVFALVAAILFGPKVIYTAVERCIIGLIVVIVAGLIYVVWEIGSTEIFLAMWDGLINLFSFPDFPVDVLADDGSVRDQLTFNRFFGRYDIAGLDFLFIAALIGGFVMAVYVPLILYMNLAYLPESARPGWINIVFMVLASAMYIAFAGYTIYSKVVEVLA